MYVLINKMFKLNYSICLVGTLGRIGKHASGMFGLTGKKEAFSIMEHFGSRIHFGMIGTFGMIGAIGMLCASGFIITFGSKRSLRHS